MTIRSGLILAVVAAFLSGCGANPQKPVAFSPAAVASAAGRIGVAMTRLPVQDTQVPGAGCVLCLVFATAANAALTTHARTLPYEDLPTLKNQVANLLAKKGAAMTVIEEDLDLDSLSDFQTKGPNLARKDFTPLKQKYQIDKLVVINIFAVGFTRNYSAYVPTSDPKGLLNGLGYMVDLKTNTYDWYLPVTITRSSDGPWDEPPKFPGLTNAYFQVLELGKDAFLQPFAGAEVPAASPLVSAEPAKPRVLGAAQRLRGGDAQ